jgi:hypothetical protein
MLILECSAKWLIWMLKNSNKNSKKINLGFGFNKRPLNLNNCCIKSNQFCKFTKLKILFNEGVLMKKNWDDVNWLSTFKKHHNLKVVKFENLKN